MAELQDQGLDMDLANEFVREEMKGTEEKCDSTRKRSECADPEENMQGDYCRFCERYFGNNYLLRRHRKGRFCVGNRFPCEVCDQIFSTPQMRDKHQNRYHSGVILAWACGLCSEAFESKSDLLNHRNHVHSPHHEFKLIKTAHKDVFQSLRCYVPEAINTLDETLKYAYDSLKKLITKLSATMNYFKMGIVISFQMYRVNSDNEIEQEELFPFRSFTMGVRTMADFTEDLCLSLGDIDRSVSEFLHRGSGWIVDQGIFIDAEISRCEPLRGCAPGWNTDLHEMEYLRGAGLTTCIEEHNETKGECFYKAIASYFLGKNASDLDLQNFINYSMVKLPFDDVNGVSVSDIKQFESLNRGLHLNINVLYQDEKKALIPVYAGKRLHEPNIIVLVLFHTIVKRVSRSGYGGEGKEVIQHYALARNPNSLFARRFMSTNTGKVTSAQIYICWNCFNYQTKLSAHNSHVQFCYEQDCQRVIMPSPWEKKSFKNVNKADEKIFKSAFILVYDFEALQISPKKSCSCSEEVITRTKEQEEERRKEEEQWEKSSREERENLTLEYQMAEGEMSKDFENHIFEEYMCKKKCPPKMQNRLFNKLYGVGNVCKHKTHIVSEQPPFAFAYVLIDREGQVRAEKAYVGEDAAEIFLEDVFNLAETFLPSLSPGLPMQQMTPDQQAVFNAQSACHICHSIIGVGDKVLDHDHLTGEILGVAHSSCNLKRRELCKMTCFSHNFIGYDSHFLIKALPKVEEKLTHTYVIPTNKQKIKAMELNKRILFTDSLAFLDGSLSSLVDVLKKSNSAFPIFNHFFKDNPEAGQMMMRKGVYPYSYASSVDRLAQTKKIPSRSVFNNDLTGEECTKEDYDFAKKVWEVFECKDLIEYTILYVKTDVYLLADAILDFRNTLWSSFGLDMAQYLSLPQLTMDAMLKTTQVSLDYISDQEMSNLVRKNIRGGLSFVSRRYEKADDDKKTLAYVDMNSLYATAMLYPLPVGDYQWMTNEEINSFDFHAVDLHSECGYFFEVDLYYPDRLHLPHNSFPLAPENVEITGSDLSPYSRDCLVAFSKNPNAYKSKKLTATFKSR